MSIKKNTCILLALRIHPGNALGLRTLNVLTSFTPLCSLLWSGIAFILELYHSFFHQQLFMPASQPRLLSQVPAKELHSIKPPATINSIPASVWDNCIGAVRGTVSVLSRFRDSGTENWGSHCLAFHLRRQNGGFWDHSCNTVHWSGACHLHIHFHDFILHIHFRDFIHGLARLGLILHEHLQQQILRMKIHFSPKKKHHVTFMVHHHFSYQMASETLLPLTLSIFPIRIKRHHQSKLQNQKPLEAVISWKCPKIAKETVGTENSNITLEPWKCMQEASVAASNAMVFASMHCTELLTTFFTPW